MEQQEPTYSPRMMTPDLAHAAVLNDLYVGQRTVDWDMVFTYALELRRGTFRRWTVITFAVLQGKRYLVNGQHLLHAIHLAGLAVEVTEETRQVRSLAELKALYRSFDRNKVRSLKLLLKDAGTAEDLGFNLGQTFDLSACLPLLAAGFANLKQARSHLRMYTHNVNIREAFVHAWSQEGHIFFQNIKGAPGQISQNLRRAAVMAVALVTIRHTGIDAEDFWHATAMDDGLAMNDPRKRLHLFLRTTIMGDYEPHVLSRYVAAAWNAAWTNRTPKTLLAGDVALPLRLDGTPHTGKEVLRYVTPGGELLHAPQPYDPATWEQGMFRSAGAVSPARGQGETSGSEI
jgi:hypothetical protein